VREIANNIRLLVASKQRDIREAIKTAFERKAYIESVVFISRPIDTESNVSRNGTNALLWDIDETPHNAAWAKSIQGKYALNIVYTSLSGGKINVIQRASGDGLLQKPAIFTPLTSSRFTVSLARHLETMAKSVKPLNMRDIVKMVAVNDRQKIIAVASSTGGTNALEELLKRLPADIPPMVVVQHMPSGFTKLFADRLNAMYPQEIREAQSGDFLMRGRMLIAPADRHMRLIKQQGKLAVDCFVGNRIHGVMPAADVLFESVAQIVGANAVGLVLTGMGNDGAKGLLKMKQAGSVNIGQNQATCVVYGMPKAAKELGATQREYPLDQIPEALLQLARG